MDSQFWYRALYLKERVDLLRRSSLYRHKRSETSGVPTNATRRRIRTWRQETGLEDITLFRKRLGEDRVSENEFNHVINEKDVKSIPHVIGDLPPWMRVVKSLVADDSLGLDTQGADENTKHSFTTIVKPFMSYAANELETRVSASSQISLLRPEAREGFLKELEKSLVRKATPSLVLELNIARLEGTLEGSTGHEKFNSFCRRLADRNNFTELLKRYPVLARLLAETTLDWLKAVTELLTRLVQDWPTIQVDILEGIGPLDLVDVKMGLSDIHRGRTVCELTFASGQKLIYKPRSLQVDIHFQDFLRWLNRCGAIPAFPTICIVDRGSYGWTEHVRHGGCDTVENVVRFYERQGGYLAVLYILGGTDIHRENLVASGEYPVIVDIETVFHHQRRSPRKGGALKLALELLSDSVMRIGLLPMTGWASGEEVDYSGFGGETAPIKTHLWESSGTDEMHLVSGVAMLKASANRTLLGKAEVNPRSYTEAIVEGFETTYKIIMSHRDELIGKNGPISSFAKDTVRNVFRSTKTYYLYLERGYHPDNLQDGLAREKLMDHLWASVREFPQLGAIVKAEHDDLMSDNIPIFTSKPGYPGLHDSRDRRIANFWAIDNLSIAKSRVAALSRSDLAKQVYFIRAALAI